MGIKIEYNPDLALRNIKEFKEGRRTATECIPEEPEEGEIYDFLKKGHRNYWLEGECPLLETDGKKLSNPIASIIIIESTHFMLDGEPHTKGRYKIVELFKDNKIRFNGFAKIAN